LVRGPPPQSRGGPGDAPDPATSRAPWHVYNIGNSRPVEVTEVVRLIEEALGKPARRELLPMQPGDVAQTYADVADLERAVGFRPKTPIEEGIRRFVDWFLRFGQKGWDRTIRNDRGGCTSLIQTVSTAPNGAIASGLRAC